MAFGIKRVYAPPEPADGMRVLVDRIWPRGLSRERASVDLWLKQIAPSHELRRWFDHEESRWEEFQERYRNELRKHPEPLAELKQLARGKRPVTLLYGARETRFNNAVALRAMLDVPESK